MKKFMKRLVLFLCVFTIMFSLSNVLAKNDGNLLANSLNLSVSKNSVTLSNKGESEFIDAIVKLEDGRGLNVNLDAEWKTDNQDVAIAYEGRILATGKGNAVVSVLYNGIQKDIKVKVLKAINYEAEVLVASNDFSTMALTPSERDTIINKCSTMINYWWKPTQDLKGWRGNFTFKANTVYNGLPYSQTEYQKDDIGFGTALGCGDFYSSYTRFGIVMPKYGNDCSGFTSFAWGVSRQTTYTFIQGIKNGTYPKVGSYNVDNPSNANLKDSYKLLQRGDAVVNDGHVFVIAQNNSTFSTPSVYAYEQTPYIATFSIWTYDQMANSKYMPFAKK